MASRTAVSWSFLLGLASLVSAWREWPHVGEAGPKWKRNWVPRELQNDTYLDGV